MTLRATQCHSLKQKRSVVRRLVERVGSRYRVALAEVGGHDTWQRIVLGFAVVSTGRDAVHAKITKIVGTLENAGLAELVDVERDLVVYGDERMSGGAPVGDGDDQDLSWVPASWLADEPGDDRESDGCDER